MARSLLFLQLDISIKTDTAKISVLYIKQILTNIIPFQGYQLLKLPFTYKSIISLKETIGLGKQKVKKC